MMKSLAVYIVGPAGMEDFPLAMAEFEICAVVDPMALGTVCATSGLKVYRSAREAMRCTGASYIDVNGFGTLDATPTVLGFA